MPAPRRILAAAPLLLGLIAPAVAPAETLATLPPTALLRLEWTVERTRAGRADIVGYLYNDNGLRHAANVWLRVEEVMPTGAVGTVYQRRIAGDVISRGRISFDVPVTGGPGATYRVVVESVDWVMECR
jgi:hypothetical protein